MTPGGYGPARGGRFGDELLDEIRAKTDIVAVIGEYVQLRKRGSNFVGLCPFHQEKTPSFTVTPDKQMFYCFGCQTGGNVFSFLMKREGLSFTETVEQVAARAGVSIPEKAEFRVDPKIRAAAEQRKREMDYLHKIVDFASRYYHQALLKSPEAEKARQYLTRRGVRPETIEKFRLGYSPRSWTTLIGVLGGKGVDAAAAERAGLALKGREGREGHYDRFRGRLMFPIGDQRGQAIGFGARALYEGDEPKYLNSPETPLFSKGRGLYGLHLAAMPIRQKGAALVVEGYMDVIACHEFAFDHAVASMGTAFTPDQARAIHRLTNTVVTAFDADAAGTQATLRGLQVLATGGFPVKVAEMPGGKDPDECLRSEGGPEAFRQAVEAAVPLVEYGYALATRRHDLATIDGRSAISRELLPFLASVDDFAEQQAYVEEFSRRLPVPVSLLRSQLDRFLRQERRPGAGGPAGPGLRDSLNQTRNNEGALDDPGASLPKQVRDAERTLLVHMVSSEENLPHVLAAMLEAAQWRRALKRGGEEAAGEAGPLVEAEPQFSPAEEPGEAGEPEGDLGVEFAPEGPLPGQDAGPAADEVRADVNDEATAANDEVAAANDEAIAGDEPTTESEAAVLEWFLDPVHRRVARGILSLARAGAVDAARLVDAVPGEVEARFIARVFYETQGASEMEWAVRDCLAVLKEHRLNSRIEELHRRISDLERRGAQVESEYTELFRELIDLERHTDGGTGHWKVPGD